jgi:23S rRNA pseudouridine2605 synthase
VLVRLNKFLSQAGAASRREADRLIAEGRVRVNGLVVDELGTKIDDGRDKVALDGRLVRGAEGVEYILLHKPAGAVTTLKDPFGRLTVKELVRGVKARVFPVGRLDASSTGVLLLTNDGDLAQRLAHPGSETPKVYMVRIDAVPVDADLQKLRRGIFLEGRKTAPAKAALMSRSVGNGVVKLEIHEGRKHEVRKMFEALGFRVKSLKRVSFAGLTAEGLKPGEWRRLGPGEVARLRKRAGLA